MAEETRFDYRVFLLPESISILIYNLFFLAIAFFFNYSVSEMLVGLLIEGVLIAVIFCLVPLLFQKVTIENYRRVLTNVNWDSRFSRVFGVAKVFFISIFFTILFFCIDFGLVLIFAKGVISETFFNSTGFYALILVLLIGVVVNLIFALAPFSRKKIVLSYYYMTNSASVYLIFFMLFVIISMLSIWVIWIVPWIVNYVTPLFLFLLILSRYLMAIMSANKKYFELDKE
ncbi:MAG: hypothetical protein WCW44_04825 [archaeon]|jgi:hypothetical protein